MRVLTVAVLLGAVWIAPQAPAALVVSIGNMPLQRNASGQSLPVFLRSNSGPVNDVIAMDIFAFVGDGSPIQLMPRFDGLPGTRQAVEFGDGPGGQPFVWDDLPSGFNESGAAPEATNVFRSTVGVDAVDLTESVTIGTTETLVGQFLIDTTGFFGSSFDFTISNTGGTSQIYTFDGVELDTAPFEGTFQVTAVPEPSSLLVVGAVAAAGVARRQVRRQRLRRLRVSI